MADRPARLQQVAGRPTSRLALLLLVLATIVLVAACSPMGAGTRASSGPGVAPGGGPTPDQRAAPARSPAALLPGDPGRAAGGGLPGIALAEPPPILESPAVHLAPGASLPPPSGAYALNLFRQGDFVAQYTFEWCVGASIQMTLNMVTARDDRTRSLQQRLWEQARDLSNSPFGGANPIGWTAALNTLGIGSYALVSEPDLDAALRRAAAALRQTRRPVGLVMWSGRHAWMMSGFTSLGDPATVPNFEVTAVRVLDPLYPHGDDRWGASPQPNALLTPAQLGTQFVSRPGGRVDLGVAPGYLLVLPQPAA